jgi:short-subunit dehydrogenase
VLSSRRETALHEVRERCVRPNDHVVQTLDLAKPDSLQQAADTVQETVGPVDVLVNNGGISQRGTAAETEMHVVRRIMEVNFFGAVQLTKAVVLLAKLLSTTSTDSRKGARLKVGRFEGAAETRV